MKNTLDYNFEVYLQLVVPNWFENVLLKKLILTKQISKKYYKLYLPAAISRHGLALTKKKDILC